MFTRTSIFSSIILLSLILSCQTVPITGRQQISLIPSDTILSMSGTEYKDFLAKHKVITGTEQGRMVARAGQRIQRAVEKYFSDHNMSSRLRDYKWSSPSWMIRR